jgi:hypothetical protein
LIKFVWIITKTIPELRLMSVQIPFTELVLIIALIMTIILVDYVLFERIRINGTGDTLYFLNRDVYRMSVLPDEVPTLFIESPYEGAVQGGFNGLGIDPWTSGVYVADAIDFVQRGVVYRYTPEGTVVDTFRTGINPGAFCFKLTDR